MRARPAHRLGGVVPRRLSQRDQPLRLWIPQRPQQDAVDDAEDRGGAANPEGEGEDGGQREGALAEKGVSGDLEVLERWSMAESSLQSQSLEAKGFRRDSHGARR